MEKEMKEMKEMKEILGLILNKLDGLESSMELRMDRLESKTDSLESKMDSLESKMGSLESKMDSLESRQDEIYLIVKAIEHNNQVHGAEIDNLKYTVNYVEGTINAIGNVITTRKAI